MLSTYCHDGPICKETKKCKTHLSFYKGQLISKCPFGVIVWTKIPTKFFPGFLPLPLKRGQIKKVV